jgi:hypothetical protein
MRLFSAIFDVAMLPVSVAKDVCTLGGAIIDEDKSATRQRIEKIEDELGME